MPEPAGPDRPHLVARVVDRAKRHPVVLALTTLVAVLVFLGTVGDLYGRISGGVSGALNPHRQEYERLARIDLGVTPQYLAQVLGPARRSADLCREIPCPPEAATRNPTMEVYESELATVQALFVDSSLEWYAVTLLSDQLNPPMEWLGHDLGALGDVTYAQALEVPGVEPTDVDVFLGPRSAAYVEVVAAGATADHRGLILANAPEAGPAGAFERDAADAVERLNDAPYDPAVAAPFRSRSQPDTFGEFVDDGGAVSVLVRDAEFTRVLLYTFASP
jgi:hypothetical protein